MHATIWDIWAVWQQEWLNPWGWILLICGIAFTFSIPWKVRLLPWTVSYILLTSIGFSYQHANFAIAPSTLTSLLALFSFLIFCSIPNPRRIRFEWMIALVGLVGVSCAISLLFLPQNRGDSSFIFPLFWNRSVGGSFIVLALAQTPLFLLGAVAAVILARSTPVLVCGTYWLAERNTMFRLNFIVPIFCALLVWKGIPTGTGRYEFWRQYWSYFVHLDPAQKIFGTHFGTTAAYLPIEQAKHHPDQFYLWLHNDFFQCLAELGIAGFVLCAGTAVELFINASRKDKAMALALCVAMSTDFLWHWFPEVLVFWIWIKRNAVIDQVSTARRI